FSSPSHFSRVFREHTGMSPSEFRHLVIPAQAGIQRIQPAEPSLSSETIAIRR
ncbi:MAG: AraC family transcriptional regulator, partial [Comamonadaceae bacterium]